MPCFPRPISSLMLVLGSALLMLPTQAPAADAWPTKPLRLVVPFPPGGGTDMVARALGETLTQRLGQTVLIENKPGASTMIGADTVAKAPPDGYTLLVSGSTTYAVNPAVRARLPYDPQHDLTHLAIVALAPTVLVVQGNAPWQNLEAFLAAGRARPGSLSYASYGAGSGPQLAATLLEMASGVQLLEVPYKGSAPALTDLMGGQIEAAIDTVAAVAPHIKAGKLRALAVLGSARSDALPNVPRLVDLKLAAAEYEAWYAVAAPGRLDPGLRARIEKALQEAMADPALQARFRAQAMVPTFVGGPDFRQRMDREVSRFRMLAHRAKIVVE